MADQFLKKRGRPAGSKNKPKVELVAEQVVEPIDLRQTEAIPVQSIEKELDSSTVDEDIYLVTVPAGLSTRQMVSTVLWMRTNLHVNFGDTEFHEDGSWTVVDRRLIRFAVLSFDKLMSQFKLYSPDVEVTYKPAVLREHTVTTLIQ